MPNERQSEAWNGPESAHYIDQADRYDRQLAPVTEAVLAQAAIQPQHRVLDVGCGSGAMALVAAKVATRVVGVDISEPLTRVARERAHGFDNVEFVVADAQTYPFDPASFDAIISQFGLMFFDEPETAFTNLRRALAADGRIVFATWRRLADNEWLAPVTRAVAEYTDVPDLGGLANGGGMFAMKDAREVTDLLEGTGFTDVVAQPISPSILVGGGGDEAESAEFLLGMGIVRGLLSRLDDDQRPLAVERIRAELAEHHEAGSGVRLGAGVWLVRARAGTSRRR